MSPKDRFYSALCFVLFVVGAIFIAKQDVPHIENEYIKNLVRLIFIIAWYEVTVKKW